MKNLVKTFAVAGLLFATSLTAFAIDKDKLNNAVVENVVEEYVNSSVRGDVAFVDQLFDQGFTQKFNTETDQPALSRSKFIQQLKRNEGVTYSCDVESQVVEKSGKYSLAKVTLDFGNFKRTDYLTMVQDAGVWKIKEVNSVFKSK